MLNRAHQIFFPFDEAKAVQSVRWRYVERNEGQSFLKKIFARQNAHLKKALHVFYVF